MPKITKIYTRAGDGGSTRLGSGQKIGKNHRRIEAYGTVDELNSLLGLAIASDLEPALAKSLKRIQGELFALGADLAVVDENRDKKAVPAVGPGDVEMLEEEIDRFSEECGPLSSFILPGGTPGSASLHLARTVCRRAERRLVTLAASEVVSQVALQYINRLSDLLFAMARSENHRKGVPDSAWSRGQQPT